jgi:3-methyladenine DNA glycosylase/8-oxoguanine DNA glycosylase
MPSRHAVASHHLASLDPVLAQLVEAHGPMRIGPRPSVPGRFEALARSIVYQQLAGRAAQAIWARTRELTGASPFTPATVAALRPEDLRGAGLSGAKAAALHDLAAKVDDGTVRLTRVGRMTDDEVVAELSQVRGIGPWTAHMFLMFHLHRLDVWPTGDYGVRNGYQRAWGTPTMPTPKELAVLGDRFRPYRSVAAWYCWRAVDGLITPDR